MRKREKNIASQKEVEKKKKKQISIGREVRRRESGDAFVAKPRLISIVHDTDILWQLKDIKEEKREENCKSERS